MNESKAGVNMEKKVIFLFFVIFLQLLLFATTPLQLAEQNLDLSDVYVIYSNVFVTGRKNYPLSIELNLTGPYKQTGWLTLISPLRPVLVVSNNTDQPFTEFAYNPQHMPTNPISNTSYTSAWDYDPINNVVFIKFLVTFTVIVDIQFGIPSIARFFPSKQVYAPSEPVEATINLYGNYTAPSLKDWIVQITVKDLVGNVVKKLEQEFQLSQSETKQLTFQMGTFDEGTYTAIAQTKDSTTEYVLTTEQLSFEIKKPEPPSPFPAWLPWALLISSIAVIVTVHTLYLRRKGHHSTFEPKKELRTAFFNLLQVEPGKKALQITDTECNSLANGCKKVI